MESTFGPDDDPAGSSRRAPWPHEPVRGAGNRLATLTALLRRLVPKVSFVEDELIGLGAIIRPGDVCLDVGAAYGLYTYTLAHLTGPSGLVHSFEPLAGPGRTQRALLKLVGARNVRQHRLALGQSCGSGTISLPRRNGVPTHGRAFLTTGANGLGSNDEFDSSDEVTTGVMTVDAIARDHRLTRVDFIKADVEGAELAVLEGARETLTTHRPTLLLEIEERHLARYGLGVTDVTTWLSDIGYTMLRWNGRVWEHADAVTTQGRNYLFVHATAPSGGA